MVECRRARRVSSARGQAGCDAGSRRTSYAMPTRSSSRGGRPAEHHPAPARPRKPRHDKDLPPGHRHRGDHRHRPHKTRTDDVRHRRPTALKHQTAKAGVNAGCSRFALPKPTTRRASTGLTQFVQCGRVVGAKGRGCMPTEAGAPRNAAKAAAAIPRPVLSGVSASGRRVRSVGLSLADPAQLNPR